MVDIGRLLDRLRADRRAITEMSDPLRAQVADLSRQIQAIAALVEMIDLGLDKEP